MAVFFVMIGLQHLGEFFAYDGISQSVTLVIEMVLVGSNVAALFQQYHFTFYGIASVSLVTVIAWALNHVFIL